MLTNVGQARYFAAMTTPEMAIPRWTLGDRLSKARKVAGLNQSQLAEEIGIARATIVNLESGKSRPSRPVLLSWALRCGVPMGWLETGKEETEAEPIHWGRPINVYAALRRFAA